MKLTKQVKAIIARTTKKASLVNLTKKDIDDILKSGTEVRLTLKRNAKAKGAFINVEGNEKLTIPKIRKIVEDLANQLDDEAKIIWGARIIKNLKRTRAYTVYVY